MVILLKAKWHGHEILAGIWNLWHEHFHERHWIIVFNPMLIQYINLKILDFNVWGLYGMSVHCPGASTIFTPFKNTFPSQEISLLENRYTWKTPKGTFRNHCWGKNFLYPEIRVVNSANHKGSPKKAYLGNRSHKSLTKWRSDQIINFFLLLNIKSENSQHLQMLGMRKQLRISTGKPGGRKCIVRLLR